MRLDQVSGVNILFKGEICLLFRSENVQKIAIISLNLESISFSQGFNFNFSPF